MAVKKEKAAETANTTTEETTAAVETTKDTSKAEAVVQKVYIGPSLPKAMLKQNTVLRGTESEIKKSLENVVEKFPLVEKMIVPVSELSEKKQKVKTQGSIYNKFYLDIVAQITAAEQKEG